MVKRRKKKKLSIKKISIFIIIIIITSTIFIYKDDIRNHYLSKVTGYKEATIATFMDKNVYSSIQGKPYSETLEKIIKTKYYNKKNTKDYLNIKYLEKDNFLEEISSLLDCGYTPEEINFISKDLTEESIKLLIDNEYVKDIQNIVSLNYFHENNLERYIKYFEKNNYDTETTITYVNIGLDKDYYTDVTSIEKQDDILAIVNKYNVLKSTYVPNDLSYISSRNGGGMLRSEAKDAFEKMCDNARKEKINISAGSGYRSYNSQLYIYNNYVARDGKAEADTYSARAGYSEHQTGLAMDIKNGAGNFISSGDSEYTWLKENSYKYGFILRYPKGKEKITGYMCEEWHYRYIGVEEAKKVYESKLTYDEYVAKK